MDRLNGENAASIGVDAANSEVPEWHRPEIVKFSIERTLSTGSTLTDGTSDPGSL